jgi:acyl-CoA thioesterase FadM
VQVCFDAIQEQTIPVPDKMREALARLIKE